MAYSDTINLVKDDTAPVLTVTLKDSNEAATGQTLDPDNAATWKPIDLTGATVQMFFRQLGSTTIKDTITGAITNASGGECTLGWNSSTLDTAGTYEGEIQVTLSSGKIQTVYDKIKFKVRADF
tara:strand:- start:4665 stop:5036 length:372 start_codon:yes stop_codon:yes gene_type:complete